MWFKERRKRKAIHNYFTKVSPLLASRYGLSEYYSEGQVKTTVGVAKVSKRFIDYALAMYTQPSERFSEQRVEVATLFDISPEYTAVTLIKLALPVGWKGGVHTNWIANKNGQSGF